MSVAGTDIISKRRLEPTLSTEAVSEDLAALAFVEQHGRDLRFCHDSGCWYRWDNQIWREDKTRLAFQFARELIRSLAEDGDHKKRINVGRAAFAGGVEKFAKGDPRVAVSIEFWDRDAWLLGTPRGTVDLRTGILRPSLREDGITKSTQVAPANQECPLWKRFLGETAGDDTGLIRFLQQWCGYSLTGITREHALVFVYGPGGNGKSVFLNVITAIMGGYATTASMDTFTEVHGDRHPADLAMLHGARLVTASETEEGRPWAEARIKQLTGGERISARFMRQDFFEFKPQFKLMIVGNHKPVLHNVDDAARRRFNIVPFMLKPERPDRDLEAALMTEAAGILQWMIEGCTEWQKSGGLQRPASVQSATDAYFSDQDLFGQWIEDCCDLRPGEHRIWDKSADLFDSWTDYAHKAGDAPGSKRAFGQLMQKRGFEPYRDSKNRGFRFVRLRLDSSVKPHGQ